MFRKFEFNVFHGYFLFLLRVPVLNGCEIYDRELVDPFLKLGYRNIPRLPRYLINHIKLFFTYLFSLEWLTLHLLMDLVQKMVVFVYQGFLICSNHLI